MEASSFTYAIRAVRLELEEGPRSPVLFNAAAGRIDRLGRCLHGLGWTREHEIGGCLMSAVAELSRTRGLPDAEAAESVRQVIRDVGMALSYTDEGLRPEPAAQVTELAAQGGTRDERE